MESLGINTGLLLTQLLSIVFLLALPIATLVDLARKKLAGLPLAVWALVICVIPVLDSLAYWIVRPAAESR